MLDQAESLRQRLAQGDRPLPSAGAYILTVTSGKGGVGKTNFSVNLGLALSQEGWRVGLLDADLGLANGDLVLGVVPQFTLAQVLERKVSLADAVITGPAGLQFLAGGTGAQFAHLPPGELSFLVEQLVAFSSGLDFLLLDTSAGVGPEVLRLAEAADEVILLTTPDPTALTDAYGVLKALLQRAPQAKVALVANMVEDQEEGKNVASRLQRAAERFLAYQVPYLGAIPYDRAVTQAVRSQQPFCLAAPRSSATRALREIATVLGTRRVPSGGSKAVTGMTATGTEGRVGGLRFFWRRFFGL